VKRAVYCTGSVQVLPTVDKSVTTLILDLSTPPRQVKPPAHCLVPTVLVIVNCVDEAVEEGLSKKAQVPPQIWAPDNRVVGLWDTLNDVAVGAGKASTVVGAMVIVVLATV
jgi:hypothetical protein